MLGRRPQIYRNIGDFFQISARNLLRLSVKIVAHLDVGHLYGDLTELLAGVLLLGFGLGPSGAHIAS